MPAGALLDSVIDALPLPALAVDPDARITALNTAAKDLLGPAALGRHFTTSLRQPLVVEAVEACLRDGAPQVARYVRERRGKETIFDVSIAAIAGTDMLLISFLDATPVTEARQMRRDFVANVSHELRTPLTSLLGFIETLQGPAKDDPDAQQRFLAIMEREAERMNRLVGDLLSLSRVEATARIKPTTPIDLSETIAATLRNLEPLAANASVNVKVSGTDTPHRVRADQDQMMQVLTNLIENAIKYGGAGKAVHIFAEQMDHSRVLLGPTLRIRVADQGPGIAPDHIARLTERFYRIDDHRSRELGGTGLGLAIVKHILNRHGGRLRVSSDLGQGSRFDIYLPLDLSKPALS